MALRQLILNKKIEESRAKFAELEKKAGELKTREAELEKALEEAETDDEVKLVEGETEKWEKENKENGEAMETERASIEAMEKEIAEFNEKEQRSAKAPKKPEQEAPQVRTNKGGDTRMITRGFFTGMSRQERTAFVQREDVHNFLEQIRSMKSRETRSISGAELTIPDIALGMLRDNMDRYSKLVSYVNLQRVSGTSRVNVLGAIPEAVWTEATGAINELTFGITQLAIDGYKVAGYIAIDISTLEDSDENLAAIILDMLGQAIGLALDKAILYGTGVNMPTGIVTRLAQTTKPANWGAKRATWTNLSTSNVLKLGISSKTGAEFFQGLISKMSVAKDDYSNGTQLWIMNKKTKLQLVTAAIAFNSSASIVSGVQNTMPVIGGEIVTLPFVPDGDIIYGYPSLYYLAERKGGTFAQSSDVRFLEDQIVYKGTARYDGQPVFGEAFVVANLGTTAPTTSLDFAEDIVNKKVAGSAGN